MKFNRLIFHNRFSFCLGWGKNKFGQGGLYQVILKLISLPIIPHEECQDKLRQTRLGRHFLLHESFICAGGEKGEDVCTGDGGSPLVAERAESKDQYYQAGIVAWGIGCGDPVPGNYRFLIDIHMINFQLSTQTIVICIIFFLDVRCLCECCQVPRMD